MVEPVFEFPLELRGHGKHLRDFARLTLAQAEVLPEREFRHVVQDLCRLLMSTDWRIDVDPE